MEGAQKKASIASVYRDESALVWLSKLEPDALCALMHEETERYHFTPLHRACWHAQSLSLVRFMVEQGQADIYAQTEDGSTPLTICIATHHDDAPCRDDIVDYLKGRGAVIDYGNRTQLMDYCERAIDHEAVRNLINYGANVNAADKKLRRPLHYAMQHTEYAPEFVDMLVCAGASVAYGVASFMCDHMEKMSAHTIWTVLVHAQDQPATYAIMNKLSDHMRDRPVAWRAVARAWGPNMRHHPNTHDTLLHLAVTSDALVDALMREWCNPWLRNNSGNLAEHPMLRAYRAWTPCVQRTRWHGPLFVRRAMTFLLVRQRWIKEGVRAIPRDVGYLIIRWVAE